MMQVLKSRVVLSTLLTALLAGSALHAQAVPSAAPSIAQPDPTGKVVKGEPAEEKPDPTKRRLSDREQVQQQKYLRSGSGRLQKPEER